MLKFKPNKDTIQQIVKEAVEIEKAFIIDALPCSLIGMNSEKMTQYIEYVSDRLLKQVGQEKVWNSANPFDFMETISLDGKTNFLKNVWVITEKWTKTHTRLILTKISNYLFNIINIRCLL